jgi:hypothetical protein
LKAQTKNGQDRKPIGRFSFSCGCLNKRRGFTETKPACEKGQGRDHCFMYYQCHFCEKEAEPETVHSITVYDQEGKEDHYEVLCDDCYEEWLISLKG